MTPTKPQQDKRLSKFKEHYAQQKKFASVTEALDSPARGHWLCQIKPLDGAKPFYVYHYFQERWIEPGIVVGMWNEMKVLLKIN